MPSITVFYGIANRIESMPKDIFANRILNGRVVRSLIGIRLRDYPKTM